MAGSSVDEKRVAKGIKKSTGELVDLPNAHIRDIKWSADSDGNLLAKVDDESYQLVTKVEADILDLLKTIRNSIDTTTIA